MRGVPFPRRSAAQLLSRLRARREDRLGGSCAPHLARVPARAPATAGRRAFLAGMAGALGCMGSEGALASTSAVRQVLLGRRLGSTGDLIGVTIRDTTTINNVDGSGWTADLTFKGMLTGGALDLSGAKALTMAVSYPGFTTAGAATTYSETVTGKIALRQPAPLQTSVDQVTSGSDVVVTATLDKRVHAGITGITAAIGADAYVQGGVHSRATASVAVTNNSAWAHQMPLWGWLHPQGQLFQGSTFTTELFVVHGLARFGQQVACVEFRVRDVATLTDQGISVKVSTPTRSNLLTLSGFRPEVMAPTINQSGLTQGTEYELYAIIYPWIAAAAWDTRTSGDTPYTSAQPQTTGLRFVCDKGSTYGNTVAYVKVGASGGAVGSSATPFPTIAAAGNALATANNAKSGGDQRNSAGGSTIYLMEASAGAGASHAGFGASMATALSAATKCYLTVTPDPAATGTIKFVTGGNKSIGSGWLRMKGITFEHATVLGNINDYDLIDPSFSPNHLALWLDTCTYAPALADQNQANNPFKQCGLTYATNCTFTNVGTRLLAPSGNVSTQYPLIGGCIIDDAYGANPYPQLLLGNYFPNGTSTQDPPTGTTNLDPNDGSIMAFNYMAKVGGSITLGNVRTRTRGMACVANLVEIVTNGANAAVIWAGDSCAVDVANFIKWHNTLVGDRNNEMYTASGITPSVKKEGAGGFNIEKYRNHKSDVFRQANEGQANGNDRTKNWAWRHAVDRWPDLVIIGDSAASTTASASSWLGDVLPIGERVGVAANFVNDQSLGNGGSAGGGNYHLSAAANASGMVPAGRAVFKYDPDGVLRKNDGNGAVGFYERTDI
jgi:hypothetical protein